MKKYFQRQFEEMVNFLCSGRGKDIVLVCDRIKEDLLLLRDHYEVDINAFPQISIDDFWVFEEWERN